MKLVATVKMDGFGFSVVFAYENKRGKHTPEITIPCLDYSHAVAVCNAFNRKES